MTPAKRILMAIALALSLSPITASAAQGGPFGLGIILGEPTGITGRYNMNRTNSVQGGISFNFDQWFLLYGDYLYNWPGVFGGQNQFVANLTPYVGVGGLIVLSNRNEVETRKYRYYTTTSSSKTAVGFRIPLGLEWRAPSFPLGVFLELVPGMTIVPGTNAFFQGGIGARFYF